jgi:hypothetical protein
MPSDPVAVSIAAVALVLAGVRWLLRLVLLDLLGGGR